MPGSVDPVFERRLAALVNDVLEAESGPHSLWQESVAHDRVRGVKPQQHRGPRNLRLLAIAALFVLGGVAAAAGGLVLLRNQRDHDQPQPLPAPSLATVIMATP